MRIGVFPYVLISFSILLAAVVTFYPIFYALQFSLHESIVFTPSRFVGLGNYLSLATQATIRSNLLASVQFVFGSVALAVSMGLVLALILSKSFPLNTIARVFIFMPWVISQMASGLIWRWLINPDYGPAVYAVGQLGVPRLDFLGHPILAMLTLIATNVWRSVAFSMIVLLAALQSIPENVSRAVAVDGVSRWRSFKDVTLPMITPSILVCVIISSLGYFNNVTVPLVLTGGGPVNATEVISLRLYREAFSYYHLGFASAIAIVIFLLNVILTLVYASLIRARAYLS